MVNVAYSGDLLAEEAPVVFGDNDDETSVYSNGYVRPIADWLQGRATGGDWRFFYWDQTSNPNEPGMQTKVVARTSWDAAAPPSDIDSYLLGPDYSFSSIASFDPDPVYGSSYATPGGLWGPYSLRITGYSESPFIATGHWAFETATGGNVDYTVADLDQGLNGIQLHSHRYDGEMFREDYEVEVGYVEAPSFLEWDNYDTVPVTLTTNMSFTEGVTVTAFGLSPVQLVEEYDQFAPGPDTGSFSACDASYFYEFSAADLSELTVVIDNFVDGDDLDLFVLYDANDDGEFNCSSEVIGNSGGGSPDPEVVVVSNPPDGDYQVAVDPYNVGGDGDYFDLFVTGKEYGDTIQVSNLDADVFDGDNDITFDVSNKMGTCSDATQSCFGGWVQVWLDTGEPTPLFDIPVTPRYSAVDVGQLSYKDANVDSVMAGDLLTYTIHVINSDAEGTVTVTDTLPAGVTLVDATAGYSEPETGVLVWDVPVAEGGGNIVTSDYEWFDISGFGDVHDDPAEWVGIYTVFYGYDDDDEGAFEVALPFDYPFFGTDWSSIYVSANGEATFAFDPWLASSFDQGGIRDLDGFQLRLAALAGDQIGQNMAARGYSNTAMVNNGHVYTYHDDGGTPGDTEDDRFIIQWDEWKFSYRPCYYFGIGCDEPYPDNTYQLILYPDGGAKVQYAEINELPVLLNWGPGSNGIEGIEDEVHGLTEGYTWHQTPATGTAWEYLPSGSTEQAITVTVQVDDPIDDGMLVNEALLDNGTGVVTPVEAMTEISHAKLDVEKSVVPETGVLDGDVVTFTGVITNTGPLSVTVALTDTLDDGLAFGDFVTPDTGLVNAGQEITGSTFITVGETFTFVYTATVTSADLNASLCNDLAADNGYGSIYSDSACLTAGEVALDAGKDASWTGEHPWPGAVLTYEVTVTNQSLFTTSMAITDVLPAELTFGGIVEPVSASYLDGVITADLVDIPSMETASLIYTATINAGLPEGTEIVNEATIVDAAGDDTTVSKTIYVSNADFSASYKEGPADVIPGDTFTYTIHISNTGTLTATATATDVMPEEVTVLTDDLEPDVLYDAGSHTITWTGDVGPASEELVEIPVEVNWLPTMLMINPGVTIEGAGAVVVTDPVFTQINSAELLLEKTVVTSVSRAPIGDYEVSFPWGEEFSYMLWVSNTGTITTTGLVTDHLPQGVEVIEEGLMPGVMYDAETHTITFEGDIPPGEGASLQIPVVGTLEAALADKALFNQFMIEDEWGGIHQSNMTKVQLMSAELEVLKFADRSTVLDGDHIVYNVLVKNLGDFGTGWTSAWQATLTDVLPDGVSLVPGSVEATVVGGSGFEPNCNLSSGSLICFFNVDPDVGMNEISFRYEVEVNEGVPLGTLLTNTVSVDDSYGVLSYAEATVEVVGEYILYLPIIAK
jgi:uncharacterized repeat protein (TIGR01451 family)